MKKLNPRSRQIKITEEDIQKIAELLSNPELKVKDIAARFGRKEELVSRINREKNIRPSPPKKGEGVKKKKVRTRVNIAKIKGSFL